MHILHNEQLKYKSILLVDKSLKDKNDRTWCFWEKGTGLFESIVYRQWDHAWFRSPGYSRLLTMSPYKYKLIRGIDFYSYCLEFIRKFKNVEIEFQDVRKVETNETGACVYFENSKVEASYVFNSILFEKPVAKPGVYVLLQHFKGYVIESATEVFDTSKPVLMDFRVNQEHGTTFTYIMPFTKNKALVEYTLFTKALLSDAQYDEGLRKYIGEFIGIQDYNLIEQEFGVIPMTNFEFTSSNGNVFNIGTAGGQTKPSTGYTFHFIQQHSKQIVELLSKGKRPDVGSVNKRFKFYDSTFLNILANESVPGRKVFTRLFRNNVSGHFHY